MDRSPATPAAVRRAVRRAAAASLAAVALGLLGVGLRAAPRASAAGPAPGRVARLVVRKGAHTLTLYDGPRALGVYRVAIGPGGAGPKLREGDKVTPTGRYHVISRNPSRYRVFLRLDYPNAADRARFAERKRTGALGSSATIGGSIGIHGAPPERLAKPLHKTVDWTAGCVALDDDEIVALSARVPDGTPVDIED